MLLLQFRNLLRRGDACRLSVFFFAVVVVVLISVSIVESLENRDTGILFMHFGIKEIKDEKCLVSVSVYCMHAYDCHTVCVCVSHDRSFINTNDTYRFPTSQMKMLIAISRTKPTKAKKNEEKIDNCERNGFGIVAMDYIVMAVSCLSFRQRANP